MLLVGDAAARPCSASSATRSTGCMCRSSPNAAERPRCRTGGAASIQRRPWSAAIAGLAVAVWRSPPGARPAARVPRRRQRPDGAHQPPCLRPAHRRLRPGSQRHPARRRRPRRRRHRRRRSTRLRPRCVAPTASPPLAPIRVNRRGDIAVLAWSPTTRPRTSDTKTFSTVRDDVIPAAVDGTGARRVRRRLDRRLHRPDRLHRTIGCRCSSAPSSVLSRSCC